MTFVSNILHQNGELFGPADCQTPTSLPSSENSNTGVCLEVVTPSPSSLTTIPPVFESSSLVASISSSSSFHTTVEDYTIIMATPTSYFPSTYPTIPMLPSSYSTTPTPDLSTSFLLKENSTLISYSSPSGVTTKQSQFITEPMKMYSSSLVTVISSSSVTYTLPYSSPVPTLATSTLIHVSHTNGSVSHTNGSVSHTNGSVSQTSAHSSLTSPEASASPTMLFCSASEDGKWPLTPVCANATSTDCGNNFLHVNG